MNERVRVACFLVAACGLGGLLVWSFVGLAPFGDYPGPYGDVVTAAAPAERQVQNVVTAINFDYRGMDTLGEEFILFASVGGALVLLRQGIEEEDRPRSEGLPDRHIPERSAAIRAWGVGLMVLLFVFGLYVVLHGQLSPGGGFQGGVVLATVPLHLFLSGGYDVYRPLTPDHLSEAAEAAGAGAYALVGLGGIVTAGAFLKNVLPLGEQGSLISGGTIMVINAAVGLEVSAGFVLLLSAFLRQLIRLRESNG
jgi:multicomponent Na+:H+ antiporter subunit B